VRHLLAFSIAISMHSAAFAQPVRPPIADPYHAHLVEGRVVDAREQGVGGLVVERMRDATGNEPFSRGAYRVTTAADGAFRFEFRGLGWGTGLTWHLAVHRPGCADTRVTVQLAREQPPGEHAIDVARNVRIQLGPCAP
jgi:hypothetical protein